jgi:peptidoglycan/xylan/chitin deacetylase (PgdA/CDA1 family)
MERPTMNLLGTKGLRETAMRGTEVGSHGMSHIRLSGLPTARLEEEVTESRHVLGEVLDGPVEGFCCPNGSLDGAATQAARRAGYSYACATWYTRAESSICDLPRPRIGDRWAGDTHHETQPLPVVLRGC